ncbi:MAG: hypothetical protein DYG89_42045 [Caldilinea sp. CFX5]|nr:hypothetical protein [Caldilinea sp. CFX5]
MWTIDARALWVDEAFEFWSAALPLPEIPRAVKFTMQPPLYSYLLHPWLAFGITPVWLRFLSVALSVLGVAALLVWARRTLDRTGLLATGALISTMPIAIHYAQEIAEYALLFCTLAWLMLCLSRTFQRDDWRIWFFCMLWGVLSIYSHYGALLVVATLSGATVIENLYNQRYRALYQQALVSALGLLLIAPLVLFFLRDQFVNMPGRPALSLMHFSLVQDSFDNLRDVLLTLWINTGPQGIPPDATLWFGRFWLLLFGLTGIYLFLTPAPWPIKRVVFWFWLLFLAYYVAVKSGAYAYGVWGGRYSSILAPLFALTGGALVTHLWRRQKVLVTAVLAFYVGVALAAAPSSPFYATLVGQERPPEARENMQQIVQTWLQQRVPTEPTYVYQGAIFTFSYYLRLAGLERHTLLSEQNAACRTIVQPVCTETNVFYSKALQGHPPADRLAALWEAFGRQPERFWLIFARVYEDEDRTLLHLLHEEYTIVTTHQGVGVVAYRLQRKP